MWKTVKLGDVCDFVRGPFGGSLKKNMFSESGYAVYEQQHAINNQCKDFRYFIPKQKFDEMRRFEVKSGDVLMSCSGTIGKTVIVPIEAPVGIINQALLKITPRKTIDVNYLSYFMSSKLFSNQLMSTVDGAAIQNVASVKILKEILIFLPPLSEQQRIVAKLDATFAEINASISLEKKQISALTSFQNKLVERLVTSADVDVKVSKISDLLDQIITGPFGSALHKADYVSEGIPVINPQDISAGCLTSTKAKKISEQKANSLSKYVMKPSDIVIGRRGEMGRCAIIPDDGNDYFCGTGCMILRPKKTVNPHFLYELLSSQYVKNALTAGAVGATMLNLNQKVLLNIEVNVRTLEKQQDVLNELSVIRQNLKPLQRAKQKKSLELNALKSAILSQELQSEAA